VWLCEGSVPYHIAGVSVAVLCIEASPDKCGEREDNRLALSRPPADDDKTTTNHPGYIIFNTVISNMKLHVQNSGRQEQKKTCSRA
jgi:hypothetical protein